MSESNAGKSIPGSPIQIAVVGIGCRFPGEANTAEKFWELLLNERDAITEVPFNRWSLKEYFDPSPDARGKMYTRCGGFLTEDISQFDAQFFEMSQSEASASDPQQRLVLEVAWEAFENALIKPSCLDKSRVGVFTGIFTHDYFDFFLKYPELANAFSNLGGIGASIAGRVSHFFDFQGPSLSVDTASSASLVAVHLACQSLKIGETDVAVAGGVNLIINPETTIGFCKTGSMSPDGKCKAFDQSANGYVRGEGCGILILKRMEDALRDGDRIHGLIVGSAVNQDGHSASLMAPNQKAQEKLITATLEAAQINPNDVGYIEAHGTGTPVGDPTEIGGIVAAFNPHRKTENPLVVGSVKTNIGHLEAAAGVAGLIKALMAVKHGQIPKNLNFKKINPNLPIGKFPLVIPETLTEWPTSGARIAGVSSFGMAGTNSHVLVKMAPLENNRHHSLSSEKPAILTFSGKDSGSLKQLAEEYLVLLQTPGISYTDICFSAANGRTHFSHRIAIVARSSQEASVKLTAWLQRQKVSGVVYTQNSVDELRNKPNQFPIGFLYSGQGVQYRGMGRKLFQTEPVFRQAIEDCAEVIKKYWDRSLLEVIFDDENLVNQTAYTQPSIFCIQYAMTQLWKSWGIQPTMVMGHSVGEFAAACAAEVFSMEDALKLLTQRASLMQKMSGLGVMFSLNLNAEVVEAEIGPYRDKVSIAAINGPQSTVLAGDPSCVDVIVKKLTSLGAKATKLNVSIAAHSPQMDHVLEEFETIAKTVQFSPPTIQFVSNLFGAPIREEVCSSQYWKNHIRQPVLFYEGLKTMVRLGVKTFLEIGPNTSLLGMSQMCLEPEEADHFRWIPSLKKDRQDEEQVLESLAQLHVQGVYIKWAQVFSDQTFNKVDLPLYPFQRKPYWIQLEQTRPTGNAKLIDLPIKESRSEIVSENNKKQNNAKYLEVLSLDSKDRKKFLTKLIKNEICHQLEVSDPNQILLNQPLQSQGIDSLRSVELRKFIITYFDNQIELPTTVVLDYPTIDLLVDFVLTKFSNPTTVDDSELDQLANDLHELFGNDIDLGREIESLLNEKKKSG